MASRVALFCATVETSQPPSKAANIRALSGTFIFSAPTARAMSQLPARSARVARLNADAAHRDRAGNRGLALQLAVGQGRIEGRADVRGRARGVDQRQAYCFVD